ncbi:hypothetical protein ACS0TY_027297 [Phlomoides rotata]
MEVVDGNLSSRVTGYYGFPEHNHRSLSWDLLKRLSRVNFLPWIVAGDFNDLMCDSDKKGRVPHPLHILRGFWNVVDECGLFDVALSGYLVTCSRGRGTSNFVEERLDRVMGNGEWHYLFPRATLRTLISPTSYHSPVCLDSVLVEVVRKLRTFRRLFATSESLDLWGRHVATAFRKNKKDLEGRIMLLQHRRDDSSILAFFNLKKKLTDLLIQEDIYWKQRVKVFWLRDGDVNSKKIHRMASTRRKKNQIYCLKNCMGV